VGLTRDVDLAEDSLQDAVERALRRWPVDGVPAEPRAWLLTVARRCAIDRMRRETQRSAKEEAASVGDPIAEDPTASFDESAVRDDVLRLLFTCCHPSLSRDAQIALSLRTLCGLSTAEVARSLLVSEATMSKRLTRAKQKIARAGIPFRVPSDDELPDRLDGVATTILLVFNEGYAASGGEAALREPLLDEGVRLARLLHELMPDEATVQGLLALLLLQDSRRATRLDAAGGVVLMRDQDRDRWDRQAIREGVELVGDGLARTPDHPDRFVVQASIAACHALAPTFEATGWDAIVSWYDVLVGVEPGPVPALNRAVAIGERDGPTAGLDALAEIEGLQAYPWWHAARAEFLRRLGRDDLAVQAASRAVTLGLNDAHARRVLDGALPIQP
jgi:RNA polymerase sigma-70 factor (ECF subfamily)